jgi:hypothetical protein
MKLDDWSYVSQWRANGSSMKNECVLTDRLVYSDRRLQQYVDRCIESVDQLKQLAHTRRRTQQRRLLLGELSDDRA